ncbi:MAG: DUF4342 domain-containing protein [Clostridiales bacterium]|nr:DUF4342 domain-containing protein [Clostridiales bacterium]
MDQEWETYEVKGSEIIDKIKKIIRAGNVNRIRVVRDGEVLLSIPVTVGAVVTILAPYLTLLGGIAALAAGAQIQVQRRVPPRDEI